MGRSLNLWLAAVVIGFFAAVISPAANSSAGICTDYEQHNRGLISRWLDGQNHSVLGHIVLHEEAAYVGGYGVYLEDISDPMQPSKRGLITESRLGCRPHLVLDGHLFVTDPLHGVISFDVSDPLVPTPVDTLAVDVDVLVGRGEWLLGLQGTTLHCLDIADPAKMQWISQSTIMGPASAAVLGGNHLYVATSETEARILVYTIIDPGAPSYHSSLALTGRCIDLETNGERLFVPLLDAEEFRIYDIGTTATPAILGSYRTPDVSRFVSADGDSVVVTIANWYLVVVDVSVPENPVEARTILNVGSPSGTAIRDGFIFIKDSDRFAVCDLARPLVSEIGILGDIYSNGMATAGNLLAVGGTAGFALVDLSDPRAPVRLSTWDRYSTTGLVMTDSMVYQNTGVAGVDAGTVYAVSVSDPGHPELVGNHVIYGRTHLLRGHGDLLVICRMDKELLILDAVDLPDMPILGRLDLTSRSIDVALDWPYIYRMDSQVIWVIDANDPSEPTVVRTVPHPLSSFASGIEVSGGYLYIHDRGSVRVFDLADPTEPQYLAGVYDWADDGITEIVAHDQILYARMRNGGVAIRTFDPFAARRQIGWIDIHHRDLCITNRGLAVGESPGLRMYPLQCTPTTVDVPMSLHCDAMVCTPNPFNPRSVLTFTMDRGGVARLDVYDLAGRHVDRIHSGWLDKGEQNLEWDGRAHGRFVASGTYFFRLTTSSESVTAKGVLLR